MYLRRTLIVFVVVLGIVSCKKEETVIYSEAEVPDYTLPELLITKKGEKIETFSEWRNIRRPEILELFASEVYGEYPNNEYTIRFEERLLTGNYLNGKAVVKEIVAVIETSNGSGSFRILYVFPSGKKNVPVFAALNFDGNHTIDTLSSITVPDAWIPNNESRNIKNNRPNGESRGFKASRWPLASIIEHGYGLATVYYGEFDPDFDDGFENGFHPLFATGEKRDKHSAGSISMWAKGMSFIADYLVQDTVADPTRIIAFGHSRLGKTALWAGANEERFAAVISNNSGCGGAALSRREYGETVNRINTVFPHWFAGQFKKYNKKVNRLPVDQHMLLALMAPRPVYVASAADDQWADPNGEFLSLKEALPAYSLSSGAEIVFPDQLPALNKPIHQKAGYHIRTGKHDVTNFDWLMYMTWADKWLSE